MEATEMKSETTHTLALRPRDAAKLLGISPRLLWQWTKDGRIPSVKINRAVLYRRASLEEFLASQETKGATR